MSTTYDISELTFPILTPDHPDFVAVVPHYVAGGAGTPGLIARPTTAAEVANAIDWAIRNDLAISVRSGGHGAGIVPNEGGLVIDLGGMSAVEVLDGGLVRVGPGARWGDVATSLLPHGLGITSGDTKHVGVGGLTLGGGIGWLVRQYGLALDSLRSVEIVTAAGDVLTASEDENPDLFWAVRGGGGNVGVVTSFLFQAHPLDGIVGGAISFPPESLQQTLTGWRDVMRSAPEALNASILAMPGMGPDMPPTLQIVVCYPGTDEVEAMAAIQPLLDLPGMTGHEVKRMDYADLLMDYEEMTEPMPFTIVGDNGFAVDFSDDLIASLAAARESMNMQMVRYLRGAFNRVPADATAFAHRESEVLVIAYSFLPPDAPPEALERITSAWAGMPGLSGSYGNFLATTGEKELSAIFPPATAARLAAIKRTWDPENVFDHNHNVPPAP